MLGKESEGSALPAQLSKVLTVATFSLFSWVVAGSPQFRHSGHFRFLCIV